MIRTVFLKELKEFPSSIEDNHRFEEPVDLPVDPEKCHNLRYNRFKSEIPLKQDPMKPKVSFSRALGWHSLHGQEHSMEPSEGTKRVERLGGYP